MPFLDDERVDVYVSTWNKSIVKNERLNLDINNTITEDGVRNDLKIPATILIEPEECFTSRRYNDKMIHRWLTGFSIIKNSGIEYDYVLVMRPDLYFDVEHPCQFTLDSILKESEIFNVAWFVDGIMLQDNMFSMTYSKMLQISDALAVGGGCAWSAQDTEGDWHTWWTGFIKQNFTSIERLGGDAPFVFARSIIKDAMSFDDAVEAQLIWRDDTVIKQIGNYGYEGCRNIWLLLVV